MKKKGKLRPAGAEKYAWFAIYEKYDEEVLSRYAKWITTQTDRADLVIDLHAPVTRYVAAKRKSNPGFTMSPDGVHVNDEGHRVLADAILRAWGHGPRKDVDGKLLQLVRQRQKLTHDAWLGHVGHKRPGVKAGLPIDEATAKAKQLDEQIKKQLAP